MSNKNYPGNESFTITLTDLWYFHEKHFMKKEIELVNMS